MSFSLNIFINTCSRKISFQDNYVTKFKYLWPYWDLYLRRSASLYKSKELDFLYLGWSCNCAREIEFHLPFLSVWLIPVSISQSLTSFIKGWHLSTSLLVDRAYYLRIRELISSFLVVIFYYLKIDFSKDYQHVWWFGLNWRYFVRIIPFL